MKDNESSQDIMQVDIMGDIREDVKVLGLGLVDVLWILVTTVVIGFIIFSLPIGIIEKMIYTAAIAIGTLIFRWMEIGYRLKRFKHDVYGPEDGEGDELAALLGVEEDGSFYRSGNDIQMVLNVQVPPWMHEKRSKQIRRIAAFEQFQRACLIEGFEVDIMAEQIPDYQHAIWNDHRERTYATEGIRQLSLNRIQRQELQARQGYARRSVYTFMLRIPEFRIKGRQRDDEPEGVSKAELHRHRMIAELMEKQKRVVSSLEMTGHRVEQVAGFVVPEILGRTWAKFSWSEWKAKQGGWAEPEVAELEEEEEELAITYENLAYQTFPESEEEPVSNQKEVTELEEDSYEELVAIATGEEIPDSDDPKPETEKLKKGVSFIHLWSILMQYLRRFLTKAKEEVAAVQQRIRQAQKVRVSKKQQRNEQQAMESTSSEPQEYTSIDSEEEEVILDYIQSSELEGVFWLTSPVSGGQSFLAANIAAARALQGQPVTLIDLSVDRGTVTLINPRLDADAPVSIKFEHWISEQIKLRDQRLLRVITPRVELLSYPTTAEIIELIEQQREYGLVLIDLPWHFPDAEQIRSRYPGAGIIDSNYHHWLRWEEEVTHWEHDLWLNQVDAEMEVHFQKLIAEQYKRPASAVFPLFQLASKYVYMGRPLAVSGRFRSYFMFQKFLREEEIKDEQDTA
ncbi:hypothetical protein [Paenibacillus bovis]|uniref:Uncharacterized protein n=1 Tax=Paenibacillus bovis TaxID=1616788 RepID=A0A1X9T465_9BACL|nr:hypothetical protein [Paenibacillus bovis]ARR10728.1 hypothetical protein AR543_p0120 [Paenibacillus bovis]